MVQEYRSVIDFWFSEIKPEMWFKKDEAFDQLIETRFKEIHQRAISGELYGWRKESLGRLAEIIVLDQFSRNMYRDTHKAFSSDSLALVLAQEAISLGMDDSLSVTEKTFLYMPFMHSESKEIHQVALTLFTQLGQKDNLDFEIRHKAIIDRFGRYPHRNAILGRESTIEEEQFLQQPGSGF